MIIAKQLISGCTFGDLFYFWAPRGPRAKHWLSAAFLPQIALLLSDIPDHEMRNYIKSLYAKLEFYEQVKEATTLIEMALWKAKLDQQTSTSDSENDKKRARPEVLSSRTHCRVSSGASVVIPRVLEYLLP